MNNISWNYSYLIAFLIPLMLMWVCPLMSVHSLIYKRINFDSYLYISTIYNYIQVSNNSVIFMAASLYLDFGYSCLKF